MARKEQTKTIDGVDFRVIQLGFAKSRSVFVRLAKCVGPAFAQLAGTANVSELGAALNDVGLMSALERLALDLSDEHLEWFSDNLGCEHSRYSIDNGTKWVKLDRAGREQCFDGRLDLYFAWLVFALEANFSDFFRKIGEAIPKAPAPKEQSAIG